MKSRPVGVLITRSKGGNEELARRLKLMGLAPIRIDTISFAPPADWSQVDEALTRLRSFDWVVFTSSTGAEYFVRRMGELSLRLPWRGRPKVAAVGRKTASALSGLGMNVGFVPSRFTTDDLGRELPGKEGEEVLLLRSDAANPGLERKLADRGFVVTNVAVYTTVPVRRSSPRLGEAEVIVFASPSAVRSFCTLVTDEELRRLRTLRAVCIGPVTESAAKESGFALTSRPGSFTLDAVVEEVRRMSGTDA